MPGSRKKGRHRKWCLPKCLFRGDRCQHIELQPLIVVIASTAGAWQSVPYVILSGAQRSRKIPQILKHSMGILRRSAPQNDRGTDRRKAGITMDACLGAHLKSIGCLSEGTTEPSPCPLSLRLMVIIRFSQKTEIRPRVPFSYLFLYHKYGIQINICKQSIVLLMLIFLQSQILENNVWCKINWLIST